MRTLLVDVFSEPEVVTAEIEDPSAASVKLSSHFITPFPLVLISSHCESLSESGFSSEPKSADSSASLWC